MRKLARWCSIILILILTLTACSTTNEEKQDQEVKKEVKNDASEKDATDDTASGKSFASEGYPEINEKIANMGDVTLEVWLAADYSEQAPLTNTMDKFKQSYPNVNIKVTGIVWEDMMNKTRLAVNGGAAPDMAHQHAFVAGNQGFAEPIDDLWTEWGAEEEFLPGAMEDVTWGGTKYGVPLDINTIMLIYNKEIYEQEGIVEAPNTLEELLEVSKQLSKEDGSRYGFVSSASSWNLFGVLVANGGDLLENGQPTLNDPVVINTLTDYIQLSKEKASPVPPPQKRQSDHPVAMFGSERAVQFISGPWDLARIKNEYPEMYDKVGTAVVPGVGAGAVSGGGSLFIPKGAANKEVSFELMKWFTSDACAMAMAKEMGRYPVKKDQINDPFFNDPLMVPFIETLADAKPYKLEAFAESNDAWRNAIRASFDGGDPEELLNSAQKIAENEIGQ
ncbi:ABC transporter substrate-binding protein [Vallitalea okinawensis]|uniref:ABC transporter substrate-binding protein n=1 Tax=Vallitalea okinawensis TaxID=2078660 RepID=UPI000CFB5314|nr:sugar ABC transporter substrate-binding protein [Vallitalea okinawensis]